MTHYLSKSDFILARDCQRKLYDKKKRYPSTLAENPYLEYLADGGFVVERIAQMLYPDGTELDFALNDPESAAEATRKWVEYDWDDCRPPDLRRHVEVQSSLPRDRA